MITAELWKPRRAKRAHVHQMRPRRACLGELVQIDGSPYDWFEGRAPACSLLVFIDDSTGRLLELYFTPQESFFSYCAALTALFRPPHSEAQYRTPSYECTGSCNWVGMRTALCGKPLALYSDKPWHLSHQRQVRCLRHRSDPVWAGLCRSSTSRTSVPTLRRPNGASNVPIRPCRTAWSRKCVCRAFPGLKAGNAFVPQFMDDFNQRFAVVPADPRDAHRPLRSTDDLDVIFTR